MSASAAQENPIPVAWTAVDPGTGIHDYLTIAPDDLGCGSAQAAVPNRFEETGDGLAVYLGEAEDPARFIFLADMNARLSVPGGTSTALRRHRPTPAPHTPPTGKPAAPTPTNEAQEPPPTSNENTRVWKKGVST